jgi:hypothetical protein
MIEPFKGLDEKEQEYFLKVPFLVCMLIAGADGDIDRKEIREAITVTQKSQKSKNIWGDYFAEVSNDFEDKLKVLIQNYPYESTQRNPIIVEELAAINKVWPKLEPNFAKNFYLMLLELAQKVASSSGGWLGIKSIGAAEAQYVKLSMISDPGKK